MKLNVLLLVAALAAAPGVFAQGAPPQQAAGSAAGPQARQERRQQMMEVHRQEMAAMKADIETLKSSLAQMKANILTIREPNEFSALAKQRGDVGNGCQPHGPDANLRLPHQRRSPSRVRCGESGWTQPLFAAVRE